MGAGEGGVAGASVRTELRKTGRTGHNEYFKMFNSRYGYGLNFSNCCSILSNKTRNSQEARR